jgi:hypothetical protein
LRLVPRLIEQLSALALSLALEFSLHHLRVEMAYAELTAER